MKVSASIYSDKKRTLRESVTELEKHGADMLHIDCKHEPAVFADIELIRSFSKLPIDLHIISSVPEVFIERAVDLRVEYISVQAEQITELPAIESPLSQLGLSIVTSTPIDEIEAKGKYCSFIQLMTTIPGESGGTFAIENFQRIIEVRHRFPNLKIHVDGGVNHHVSFILRMLGAHVIVSGSHLMNQEFLSAGLLSLYRSPDPLSETDFVVSDFMTPLKYLPVLNSEGCSFVQVLETIEHYRQGFVLLTGADGRFEGVITNADVRRGLLAHKADLNTVEVQSIINRGPVTILNTTSLSGMQQLLNELSFVVLFLPVVDESNKLLGAVLLNNLVKG